MKFVNKNLIVWHGF